jgi:putative heme transporter
MSTNEDATPEPSELPSEIIDGDLLTAPPERVNVRRIVIRVAVMTIALGVASFVLFTVFSDLDPDAIVAAVRGLSDAERIALIGGTVMIVGCEGLQTASLVPGLPARRGAIAWLGPNAISSITPGPGDLPVRYRMFVSWGQPPAVAATAIGANSIFTTGAKVVLPAIAGTALTIADVPLDGIFATIVTAAVVLALIIAVAAVILGSERRTAAAARVVERVWRRALRLLRRSPETGTDLADRLVARRADALELLRTRWKVATGATVLVVGTRVALLIMCVRFAGVPESAASSQAIFCVFAIVMGLTVIPLMPGNVGVSELAYVGLLTPIAGTEYANEVTAGVLVFRMLTWLLLIPTGLIALAIWRHGLRAAASVSPR